MLLDTIIKLHHVNETNSHLEKRIQISFQQIVFIHELFFIDFIILGCIEGQFRSLLFIGSISTSLFVEGNGSLSVLWPDCQLELIGYMLWPGIQFHV